MTYKKIISIDFDGVLNSYSSGWIEPDFIPDPPVPGAMKFLDTLINDHKDKFDVQIFSSRNRYKGGPRAMLTWIHYWAKKELELERANAIHNYLSEIINNYVNGECIYSQFPAEKPPAHLTIDDRALTFKGVFPSTEEIEKFTPWNKVPFVHPIKEPTDAEV